MQLKDLLQEGEARILGPLNADITALSLDSRKVSKGGLFAALQGLRADGSAFINDAIKSGALAILAGSSPPENLSPSVSWIKASEPRRLLAKIAARFYGRQPQVIVAITGTSGKTSVASFLQQIYSHCGFLSASLGTLGLITNEEQSPGLLTTPDPVALHALLAKLTDKKITHLAIEASSHGLDQYRLDGVKLTAGAFTNLSRDHLDYHPTMDAYLQAKLRLVNELLPQGAPFLVSADIPYSDDFIVAAKKRGLKPMTVGVKGEDFQLLSRERLPNGQRLSLGGPWGRAELVLPLIGDFQAENALLAAGLAIATGCLPAHVLPSIEKLTGVKGRVEKVADYHGAGIYVDYAHKPDALAKLLQAMRPYTQGRLILVFGCGGERDAGKRPLMGEIADQMADDVIVTDDNPRRENPANIRMAILAAAPKAIEIADRTQAIEQGIKKLQAGDVLVVAGKGHESGQIIGDVTQPFSDQDVVKKLLAGEES
jgi:UDP-N-acetylmuramoyl-L-alanyl-D-glutamate--2,6-diaminopimelate ligase